MEKPPDHAVWIKNKWWPTTVRVLRVFRARAHARGGVYWVPPCSSPKLRGHTVRVKRKRKKHFFFLVTWKKGRRNYLKLFTYFNIDLNKPEFWDNCSFSLSRVMLKEVSKYGLSQAVWACRKLGGGGPRRNVDDTRLTPRLPFGLLLDKIKTCFKMWCF